MTSNREEFYAKVKGETERLTAIIDAAEARTIQPADRKGPTGPRTEAGKQKSRLNAYKHGLTGQIHLFTPEEKIEFALHCQTIIESLAPVGGLETTLAQTIAENHWRLKHSRAIETTLWASCQEETEPLNEDPQERRVDDAELQLRAWMTQHKHIQLMTLYESRIQRVIDRSMAELRTLRAERQALLEEEVLLAELAESKGESYDPLPNPMHPEFVCTTREVRHALTRKKLLEEARARQKASKPEPQTKRRAKK